MLQSTGTSLSSIVRKYYIKRAKKLLPAYLLTNVSIMLLMAAAYHAYTMGKLPEEAANILHVVFRGCPQHLWANLCFLTHYLGWQACGKAERHVLCCACSHYPTIDIFPSSILAGTYLWTFTQQAQFYIAFPLALCSCRPWVTGFRTRVCILIALVATGGTFLRILLTHRLQFTFPMAQGQPAYPVWDIVKNCVLFLATRPDILKVFLLSTAEELANYFTITQAIYFSTSGRLSQLAIGALLGLAMRCQDFLAVVEKRCVYFGSYPLLALP